MPGLLWRREETGRFFQKQHLVYNHSLVKMIATRKIVDSQTTVKLLLGDSSEVEVQKIRTSEDPEGGSAAENCGVFCSCYFCNHCLLPPTCVFIVLLCQS